MKSLQPTPGFGSFDQRPLVVGIGGTARYGSSSQSALMVSLRAAQEAGARTALLTADDLMLPMYGAACDAPSASQEKLVALIRAADGVIISSPSYHGTVSGMVKNALDYIEELRGDERPYLDGRSVGLIACAAGWQGAGQTMVTLRGIVHALRGWPTPYGAVINTSSRLFSGEGECSDATVRDQLETVGRQVVEFALMRGFASRARNELFQEEEVAA